MWPAIGPRLEEVIDKLDFVEVTLPEIYQNLVQGQAQLWIAGTGEMIAVTRIGAFKNFRRLFVDFIEGSNPDKYTEHMEYIEHWATTLGATQAEADLRPGMERIARQQGWTKRRVKMFKHLKQGLH